MKDEYPLPASLPEQSQLVYAGEMKGHPFADLHARIVSQLVYAGEMKVMLGRNVHANLLSQLVYAGEMKAVIKVLTKGFGVSTRVCG